MSATSNIIPPFSAMLTAWQTSEGCKNWPDFLERIDMPANVAALVQDELPEITLRHKIPNERLIRVLSMYLPGAVLRPTLTAPLLTIAEEQVPLNSVTFQNSANKWRRQNSTLPEINISHDTFTGFCEAVLEKLYGAAQKENVSNISTALTFLRLSRGLTQKELAHKLELAGLNMSDKTGIVERYESGVHTVEELEILDKIVEPLRLSFGEAEWFRRLRVLEIRKFSAELSAEAAKIPPPRTSTPTADVGRRALLVCDSEQLPLPRTPPSRAHNLERTSPSVLPRKLLENIDRGSPESEARRLLKAFVKRKYMSASPSPNVWSDLFAFDLRAEGIQVSAGTVRSWLGGVQPIPDNYKEVITKPLSLTPEEATRFTDAIARQQSKSRGRRV